MNQDKQVASRADAATDRSFFPVYSSKPKLENWSKLWCRKASKSVSMSKKLLGITLLLICFVADAAGLRAEQIVTYLGEGLEKTEIGEWIEDEEGRTRYNIDEWTEIADPIQGVVFRANSKRGRYSKKKVIYPLRPMGTPLIDITSPIHDPGVWETKRTRLGTQKINGVLCEGTLVNYELDVAGRTEPIEIEAWTTDEFIFPFNMLFKLRTKDSEQITELRNVIMMTEAELEGLFMPSPHWKESRFLVVRTNKSWTGVWPLIRSGSKVTGTVLPWPNSHHERDRFNN